MTTRNIKKGHRGAQVKRVQEALIRAGIQPGLVDGIFGPKTENAVCLFQKRLGLPVTGIVDAKTGASLLAILPGQAPPVLYRNPANPYQRHLMSDDHA